MMRLRGVVKRSCRTITRVTLLTARFFVCVCVRCLINQLVLNELAAMSLSIRFVTVSSCSTRSFSAWSSSPSRTCEVRVKQGPAVNGFKCPR